MKTTVAFVHSADEIMEVRVAMHDRVIVSRVNYSHLARIRQTLAAIERIRVDAVRIGLYELALAPTSISRDFLSKAAVAPVSRGSRTAGTAGVRAPSGVDMPFAKFA